MKNASKPDAFKRISIEKILRLTAKKSNPKFVFQDRKVRAHTFNTCRLLHITNQYLLKS